MIPDPSRGPIRAGAPPALPSPSAESEASGCWTRHLLQPPCPRPCSGTRAEAPMTIQKHRRLTPVHLEPPRSWVGPGGQEALLPAPCFFPPRSLSRAGPHPPPPRPSFRRPLECSTLPVCPSASSSSQTATLWQRLS